jgi:hypothetical protein
MSLPSRVTPLVCAALLVVASSFAAAPAPSSDAPPARPLRNLYTSDFPFDAASAVTPAAFKQRQAAVRDRVLLAAGLFPLPTKTPLQAVVHGRVERDDYTIDRVFFESFPGHYVCGNLYLPKRLPPGGKMPGILCPHGHWPKGRFMDLGPDSAETREQLAIGAERFESGARSPLQARCVQLARMGCAVFFYDTLGNADSIQISNHRSGRRPELDGTVPGTFGLYSAAADLRLQSNFGLQTWNSVRALDFLLTVPGVDPRRISCTGASGGGTQTMMLAAIDDRLATAFPCVMVSTAMQGGCTCENASYLRIKQGNIDIAAAFAPKPMGMTAADDWTKELATKGFPDLKAVWKLLGRPNDVQATFNTHWKHNYNHVSRTTMYGFMNQHFKLGYKAPVLERDFVLSSSAELTVWTSAHPAPTGDRVGGAHEKALLQHWSDDSDRLLQDRPDLRAKAWAVIVGRAMPRADEVTFTPGETLDRRDYRITRGTAHYSQGREAVPVVTFSPPEGKGNGFTVLWLAARTSAEPDAAQRKLLDAGFVIVVPQLSLPGATRNPQVTGQSGKRGPVSPDQWESAACYTYGYNHPLVVHRVHDAMTVVTLLRQRAPEAARIILVAGNEMGATGALAAATLKASLHGAVIDTEGFRFASLRDQFHPQFVPGAVKYGDVPALLSLAAPGRLTVLGEKGVRGGPEALAQAVSALAQ